MNANELRIGCKIQAIAIDGILTVLSIKQTKVKDGYHTSISFYENEGMRLPEHCVPIPLTPDILEKCGLVMHKDIYAYSTTGDEYFYIKKYLIPEDEYYFAFNDYKSHSIQYLHQLQNLYFALTGKELTVNF